MNRRVAEVLDGGGVGQSLGKPLNIVLDLGVQTADHVLGIGQVLPGRSRCDLATRGVQEQSDLG